MKVDCYKLSRGSIWKNSILESMKTPLLKFVLASELFILEVPVHRACKELDIAYNTAYKICDVWI